MMYIQKPKQSQRSADYVHILRYLKAPWEFSASEVVGQLV